MTSSAIGQAGTRNDGHRLGVALTVIAAAQLMVVLDATIVIVAQPHIQAALGRLPQAFVSVTLGGAIIAGVSAALGAVR